MEQFEDGGSSLQLTNLRDVYCRLLFYVNCTKQNFAAVLLKQEFAHVEELQTHGQVEGRLHSIVHFQHDHRFLAQLLPDLLYVVLSDKLEELGHPVIKVVALVNHIVIMAVIEFLLESNPGDCL